jgi:putative phosphoesterase
VFPQECDDEVVIVGLISDTHGLVRPALYAALDGVELILHAGDVGDAAIVTEIRAIAPVYAVYGNTDARDSGLPGVIDVTLGGLSIHMSHGHELGSPTPANLLARYNADVIVFGHTHKPLVERAGRRLVVNPGAAGPRRFSLKPSVARMTIVDKQVDVEIVWL